MAEQGNAPVEQPDVSVTPPEVETVKPNYVTLETHRRLLDEKKKDRAKLDELLEKERIREEADALKRGEFDKIRQADKEELAKERQRRIQLEEAFNKGMKLNAVIEALGGNVDPRLHRLIDLSEVAVDPDTGEVESLTAAKVAESLKREWPELVRQNGRLPAAAPQGLQGGAGKIAYAEWLKLPPKEMAKWKFDQILDP